MQRERDTIQKSLTKKGFNEIGGDHYFFQYVLTDGTITNIKTKMSRGSSYKTCNDSLLNLMAIQCKLDKKNFINLIDCPLSRDDYEKILKKII
ncbi:MAG: hypothetical protein Ta2D_03560 [Rickettsiales bacterium]|nr:MAG: hypothetical protein Ta2D_03560 [Rickettsiales bacterium]